MTDFLLELRCEEIPARMQAGARADLEKLFREHMAAAGVLRQAQDERELEVTVWSTPRRLALIARDLPRATEAVREELKGPRTSAPPQAVEGFLRKTGLAQDQLEARGDTYFAIIERPGRATPDVLAWAIVAIVAKFPWPKSMRWGAASLSTESPRWVRPLSGIVAIFGDALVECQVGEVASGCMTLGHRFHHPGPITIGGAADYQEKLRACHVIVDHAERQDLIRAGAMRAAAEAGLALVADEGLVIENAGLTEWPVPLVGRFDPAFLDVPPEVIQLTARVNQKYFVCTSPLPLAGGAGGGPVGGERDIPTPNPSRKREGDLADAFVCTANIEASDGGASIVDGNRKVLAARLSDARFFWDQDRKTPLAEHAKKLERITFHDKLGTVADKVERVAKLARWLVEEGIVVPPQDGEGDHAKRGGGGSPPGASSPARHPSDSPLHRPADGPPPRAGEELADLAEQAARLCKADLVTEMVGEFPELQGLMGGYYARAEGLPGAVADAIRDHYKPVGQGDEVPTAPVTVAVSLADKLDTLASFFAIGETPTGSKDPFALRRAALGVIAIAVRNSLRLQLFDAIFAAWDQLDHVLERVWKDDPIRQFAEMQSAIAKITKSKMDEAIARQFNSASFMLTQKWDAIYQPAATLNNFFADRLKVQQREAGVRHDLIDAVFALGGEDDLVRLLARVKALQAFIGTEDGVNLHAGYKRAANILKKEDWDSTPSLVTPAEAGVHRAPGAEGEMDSGLRRNDELGDVEIPHDGEEDPFAMADDPDVAAAMRAGAAMQNSLSYTPEPAEKALIDALDAAGPDAAAAIEAEDFAAAMRALALLRSPIDRFFDMVTVNDDDPLKRAARLDLLARFRDAVHRVADFSRIEG